MRLWSLNPSYLDARGLTAVWREALLAQKVLMGLTRGYRTHPQLHRFRSQADPVGAVGAYLAGIADEADRRGYRFDRSKIAKRGSGVRMTVRRGQVEYEWRRLMEKLRSRSPGDHARSRWIVRPRPHPLFRVVPGVVEEWERTGTAGGRR